MQEKLFQAGNVLATITATFGTLLSEVWPLAIGFVGWGVNILWKWRKESQEYRHREELHRKKMKGMDEDIT